MVVGKHILSKRVLTTVNTELTLKEALEVLNETGFLSIPVMDKDNKDLEGVLYKSKIYEGLFESELSKEAYLAQKVDSVYKRKSIKIQSDRVLEEAADLLTNAKQSFIPVYEGEELAGILTHTAIFEAYSNLLGVNKGVRLSLTVTNLRGRLAILAAAVSKLGGDIISFAIQDTQLMSIVRLVVRVENCDVDKLMKEISKKGFKLERID